jgi:hypothetical protein
VSVLSWTVCKQKAQVRARKAKKKQERLTVEEALPCTGTLRFKRRDSDGYPRGTAYQTAAIGGLTMGVLVDLVAGLLLSRR